MVWLVGLGLGVSVIAAFRLGYRIGYASRRSEEEPLPPPPDLELLEIVRCDPAELLKLLYAMRYMADAHDSKYFMPMKEVDRQMTRIAEHVAVDADVVRDARVLLLLDADPSVRWKAVNLLEKIRSLIPRVQSLPPRLPPLPPRAELPYR